MCACANNHASTCALLLSYGADLCASNDRGTTALHIAAFLGSLSIIHELVNMSHDDADTLQHALNQGDLRNQTALFQACIEGHTEIALALLYAGADAYHLDDEHQTCLHAMLSTGVIFARHIRLFYRLIEFVDYRSSQDDRGRTLLDLASLYQLNSIVYLLTLLGYTRNYQMIVHAESSEPRPPEMFSLRQLCTLAFKRSVNHRCRAQPMAYRDLLEIALRQCFQTRLVDDANRMPQSCRKSLDDITMTQRKPPKPNKVPNKKTARPPAMFSSMQNDLERIPHVPHSWLSLTNKFKPQRAPQEPVSPPPAIPMPSDDHPVKAFASTTKLDGLLDFPSLSKNHDLLEHDLRVTMSICGFVQSNLT